MKLLLPALTLVSCSLCACEKPATPAGTTPAPPVTAAPPTPSPAGSSAPAPGTTPVNTQLVKVYVKTDGTILADGRATTIDALEGRLQQVAAAGGECWYYREDLSGNAHPLAERVLQLVQKHNCRLSISTTPDFSTYLDAEGEVHPRR